MKSSISEQAVQEFWTDYPMIFYGKDIDSTSPEEIFDFMEQSFRNKAPHLQDKDAPLLSRFIDYSAIMGKALLEIGYGTGWLLSEFLKAGAKVSGIDLSHSHYELSSHRFKDQDIDLRVASAEAIPFSKDSFDVVVSWGVLHHASDDQKCYDEVHRVLKPGGRCFMMLYRKGGVKYYYNKLFKLGILRGGLARHGYNMKKFITSVTDIHYDGSPGAPISRHYVYSDLRSAFAKFSQMKLEITGTWGEFNGIPAARLPISDWLLTDIGRVKLLSKFGGFWLVELVK